MGFLSELVNKKSTFVLGQEQGVESWRRVFGGVDKERPVKPDVTPHGGSFTRSVTTEAGLKRLLEALRSRAPGGWTDNRYEQSGHFVGIAYVAIHRLSEQMSQAEFQVFQKDDSHPDGKVPAKSEGARKLIRLLEKPNQEDSFGDLLYGWTQQMSLTGSALTWVVPNAYGEPYELYPIETAIATPGPILSEEYPRGYYQIQPIYPYGPFSSFPTPLSAVGARIPAEWMLRIKYKHPLIRYEGYSPLTALRLHLDEVEAMDRSRWYSMKRTFRPNMVLNMADMEGAQPMPSEEIERIKTEIENAFMGPENAGNLFIPAPGTKLEEFGTVPRDMDYQSGWEQLVSFCLGGFGITKPAAGMIEDASYSTLFATLKQLYWLTLEPAVNRLSSKLTRFLAPFFGDDLIVEVRCKRIDDHEVKFQAVDKLIAAKAITKNETRRELGLPLTKEEWGNEIAGFEEPPVPPGMGMPGVEAGPGGGEGGGEGGEENPLQDLQSIMDGGDEADTENSRPNPEGGNRGSLGTRPPREKRLYDKVMKVMRNGHHKRL